MNRKKEEKTIPSRNYIFLIFLMIGAVLIPLYVTSFYKMYQREKLKESYLIKTNTILHEIKNLDELDAVLMEAPSEYFLYISYTNSIDTYKLEKDLKEIIDDYGMKEEFYFLNVTDMLDDDNFYSNLNNILNLSFTINKVPIILYYKDNTFDKDAVVEREYNTIIEAADFKQLIDEFGIKSNEK